MEFFIALYCHMKISRDVTRSGLWTSETNILDHTSSSFHSSLLWSLSTDKKDC